MVKTAGSRGDIKRIYIGFFFLSFAPAAQAQTVGAWINVTPASINPAATFGTQSVIADPQRPQDLYFSFDTFVFKSTDYGQTWNVISGPSFHGGTGLAIAPGNPPTLFSGGINGPGIGFWRSVDGGFTWQNFNIGPAASGRQ